MENNRKLEAFFIIGLLALCLVPGTAHAAAFDDPTWPCQQRKVEDLSLGIMWTSALPQDFHENSVHRLPKDAQDLVVLLSLRRVSLEQAENAISSYSRNTTAADEEIMLFVFAAVFDTLGDTRRDVINGIEQYSLKQIALSERIETVRSEMRTLSEAEDPDFDRIDRLEEQLDWDERVFRDRARSLTYVCETPVLIEKRLYAIAKLLLKYARQASSR